MPSLRFRLPPAVVEAPDWTALRAELHIDEVQSPEVLAAAEAAAQKPLPDVEDRRDLPFITLDPAGSRDLDQAMHLEKTASGYRVHYAIADVSHFVSPDDALDVRAHQQGQTFYGPDKKIPLYPFVISEGSGSLLPDEDRPAILWELELDATGELVSTHVRRALVRSRRQLAYETDGEGHESLALLEEVGTLRDKLARRRDAVDLPSPEQVVEEGPDGPTIRYRITTPLEMWNSQISLLTGMAAAKLMLDAKVGMLRTLPKADEHAVASLRLSALALGIDWPQSASYGDVVSRVDAEQPNGPAFLNLAARLLRGASYASFDGAVPESIMHSGVGAPYAHCTAPLRRLADRYVSEICVALCAGAPIPDWARTKLGPLPKEMSSSDQRAHALNRAIIDATETYVLGNRVGEEFDAVVVDKYEGDKAGTALVQLREPAVRAVCRLGDTDVQLGARLRVRCTDADLDERTVSLRVL